MTQLQLLELWRNLLRLRLCQVGRLTAEFRARRQGPTTRGPPWRIVLCRRGGFELHGTICTCALVLSCMAGWEWAAQSCGQQTSRQENENGSGRDSLSIMAGEAVRRVTLFGACSQARAAPAEHATLPVPSLSVGTDPQELLLGSRFNALSPSCSPKCHPPIRCFSLSLVLAVQPSYTAPPRTAPHRTLHWEHPLPA